MLIIIAIISFYELKNISFNNLIFIFSLLILTLFLYSSWELRNLQNGFYLILFVLFICIFTDIGGYLFGKTFKGPKISSISPNKTYSGMVGSFLLPIIVIFFFLTSNSNFEIYDKIIFIYNLNLSFTIFFISLVSQLGDFMISYLKRKSNKKDTGNIIPGHGGLLDRIDGIIFATIFYNLIIKANI
jgi:phosphatidate cytidylyltransferase